jgi:hypothetical protein
MTTEVLDEDYDDNALFEERAAIMQFCGDMLRAAAERAARADLQALNERLPCAVD